MGHVGMAETVDGGILMSEFYVSPSGSPSGDGTIDKPWNAETALGLRSGTNILAAPSPLIKPGDHIWARGGIYTPLTDNGFMPALKSTDPSKPIIFQNYNGERATFQTSTHAFTGSAEGDNVWYFGIEFTSLGGRAANEGGGANPLSYGVRLMAPGVKFIHCIVHDTAQGFSAYDAAPNTEIYGCLSYYNGWRAPDRPHGHGVYAQNAIGTKMIDNNIIFDNCEMGIQAYGSGGANITGVSLLRNVVINSGSTGDGQYKYNLVLGGGKLNTGNNVEECDFFFNPTVDYGYLNFGQYTRSTNNKFKNNTVVGGFIAFACEGAYGPMEVTGNQIYTRPTANSLVRLAQFAGDDRSQFTWDRNDYFGKEIFVSGEYFYDPNIGNNSTRNAGFMPFAAWKASTGFDANSTFSPNAPTKNKIRISPSKYEQKRAHVVIHNWENLAAVTVDLSGVLSNGDQFVIQDAQNFYGPPVVSGAYAGPVSIPMNGLVKAASHGLGTPPHTAPLLGTFVVMRPGPAILIPQPPPGSNPVPPPILGGTVQIGDSVLNHNPNATTGVRSDFDSRLEKIGNIADSVVGKIVDGPKADKNTLPKPNGSFTFWKVQWPGVLGWTVEDYLRLTTAPPNPIPDPVPVPTAHKASLAWQPSPSAGITGYNVYRAAVAGGPYNLIKSGIVTNPIAIPSQLLTYIDTTVVQGEKYFYAVSAVSAGGESVMSNEASGTVPVDNPVPDPNPNPVPPQPPSGLTVTVT